MYALLMLIATTADAKPEPLPRLQRQLIVVSEAQLKAANDAAVAVFGKAGENSFTVQMQQTDSKAIYYVACWRMTDAQRYAFAKAMQAAIDAKTISLYSDSIAETKPTERLSQLKIKPVEKEPAPIEPEKER